MDIKPKTYVFTVRYKDGPFSTDWEFKNVVIEDCVDVKSALNKLRGKFKIENKLIIDNIYSEET